MIEALPCNTLAGPLGGFPFAAGCHSRSTAPVIIRGHFVVQTFHPVLSSLLSLFHPVWAYCSSLRTVLSWIAQVGLMLCRIHFPPEFLLASRLYCCYNPHSLSLWLSDIETTIWCQFLLSSLGTVYLPFVVRFIYVPSESIVNCLSKPLVVPGAAMLIFSMFRPLLFMLTIISGLWYSHDTYCLLSLVPVYRLSICLNLLLCKDGLNYSDEFHISVGYIYI